MANKSNALPKTQISRKKSNQVNIGYTLHNKVKLVEGGKHFFDLLVKQIGEAKQSIHIQTYALNDDETGTWVADALIKAAKRQVEVYLLVDGYASQKLGKRFIETLRDGGVHFRLFQPLLKSKYFYFGRRLHHKIHVFDGIRAIVGSMNIADRYNDVAGEKSWLDMALYVEGETAVKLQTICWQFWRKIRKKILPDPNLLELARAIPEQEQVAVRVRQNDWVMRKIQISKSYFSLFGNATESIYIMCSYFLPGRNLLGQLKKAARKGVAIHVVLAGASDVKSAKFAERYMYRWMLRQKMKVYEYQPSVLHAKLSIADSKVFTIGSFNINGLSAYASIELNLDVKDEKTGGLIVEQIKKLIKEDCKPIDEQTYVYKLFTLRQLLFWFSYQFMKFMLMISTFYYKQHRD